jgi:hypothetical protein
MDAITSSSNAPVVPLRPRGIQQARIPLERYRDGPSIHQADAQFVLRELDVGHAIISSYPGYAHPRPPRVRLMLGQDPSNLPQLMRPISTVTGQLAGAEPERGREVLSVNMNMSGLIRFMAVEVEPVGPSSQHRRHRLVSFDAAMPRLSQPRTAMSGLSGPGTCPSCPRS